MIKKINAAFALGENGDASWAVNKIGSRAGMPTISNVTRDKIRHERKIELAFEEGHRYFDLKRWRTAVDKLTGNYHGIRYVIDGANMKEGIYDVLDQKFYLDIIENIEGEPDLYFDTKYYYLPISSSRISRNSNLVENPGYQY